MTLLFRKLLSMNWWLTAILGVLIVFGINAIELAGADNPNESIVNAHRTQLMWVGIGIVVYFTASLIDYRYLRWLSIPGMLAGIGLLAYSLAKAEKINDTQGWISVGNFSFQPSQFAMAAAIIATATALTGFKKAHDLFRTPFARLACVGLLMGLPCLLVLAQGDVGSALVWVPVAAALCIIGNIPLRHLLLVLLAVAIVLPPAYYFGLNDQRRSRIEVYLDMLHGRPVDIQNEGYAAYNVSTAVGSGGWDGYENYFRRQEARSESNNVIDIKPSVHAQGKIPFLTVHTDFIFAVIAEHYGFKGSALLIASFATLLTVCCLIAWFSRDLFGRLLVGGCAALIFAHVFQNIGMTILLTPITGIPLPFISYGGTFLVVLMGLMGICQSVWIHRLDFHEDILSHESPHSQDWFPNRPLPS